MENEKKPRKPQKSVVGRIQRKNSASKTWQKTRANVRLEHRENLSNSAKGKKHTAEAKAKISASKLGKKKSPEHRQKLSAAHMGKVMSSEQKMKHLMTSLNSTKGPMAVEIREKISDSHKGKKLSEKNKLRSSLTKRGIEHIHIKGKLFTSLRAAAESLGHRYHNALSSHLNSRDPLWKDCYYLDDADKNP